MDSVGGPKVGCKCRQEAGVKDALESVHRLEEWRVEIGWVEGAEADSKKGGRGEVEERSKGGTVGRDYTRVTGVADVEAGI